MFLSLNAIGYNTEKLKDRRTIQVPLGVGLYVHGLRKSVEFFPDGRVRTADVSTRNHPALRLYFGGGISSYEYDLIRENWWITLHEPVPIYYHSGLKSAVYRDGKQEIPIPSDIALDESEVPQIRRQFSQIQTGLLIGTAQGRAAAELLLAGILARFLLAELPTAIPNMADRFRQLIDTDVTWEYTLEELADRLGLCRDSARTVFVQRFGIAPGKYRARDRLGRVLNMISGTDQSMKEIAFACGFKNVTYLNSLIRKNFNLTPLSLRRQIRSKESSSSSIEISPQRHQPPQGK